ncbi:MAG: hypothetical protein QOD09_2071 [Bradyrhizobium sp.]|jgi:hypothetical protein|nr:hypothetical protein [Bradyrhizobium sp.]
MTDSSDGATSRAPMTIRVKDIFVGVLLVVLTLLISGVAVIVLSCTLTQGRMSSLSIDGVTLNIWKLNAIRQDWEDARDSIHTQEAALTDAKLAWAKKNSLHSVATQNYESAQAALLAILERANFEILPIDEALAKAISRKGVTEQIGRIQGALGGAPLKDHPELKDLVAQIMTTYHKDYLPTREHAASARAESFAAEQQTKDIANQIKASKDQIQAVYDNIKPKMDDAGRAKVEAVLYEITPIEGPVGKFMNRVITLPSDVLALSLVILMGVLGSLLQIVYSFFRKDTPSEGLGIYFVRIAAGGITALVIFIVTKAGIPIIADASRLGGDAPINPYLISFLAIISGLLSEQAIASVQARGAQFFPANPTMDVPRWARMDLTQNASSDGKSIDQLATYLNLKPKAVADILKGLVPATIPQQNAIVTYLHGSARDIFTDIAPAEADSLADTVQNDAAAAAEKPGEAGAVDKETVEKDAAAGSAENASAAAEAVQEDAAGPPAAAAPPGQADR